MAARAGAEAATPKNSLLPILIGCVYLVSRSMSQAKSSVNLWYITIQCGVKSCFRLPFSGPETACRPIPCNTGAECLLALTEDNVVGHLKNLSTVIARL